MAAIGEHMAQKQDRIDYLPAIPNRRTTELPARRKPRFQDFPLRVRQIARQKQIGSDISPSGAIGLYQRRKVSERQLMRLIAALEYPFERAA